MDLLGSDAFHSTVALYRASSQTLIETMIGAPADPLCVECR